MTLPSRRPGSEDWVSRELADIRRILREQSAQIASLARATTTTTTATATAVADQEDA